MKNILLLEPDRIAAVCLSRELAKHNFNCYVASTAHGAIKLADDHRIDAVISELSLPGHSGSEFLYEFRTYPDWSATPIIIFSSIKVAEKIACSKDWELLCIAQTMYKPEKSLQDVVLALQDAIGT